MSIAVDSFRVLDHEIETIPMCADATRSVIHSSALSPDALSANHFPKLNSFPDQRPLRNDYYAQ